MLLPEPSQKQLLVRKRNKSMAKMCELELSLLQNCRIGGLVARQKTPPSAIRVSSEWRLGMWPGYEKALQQPKPHDHYGTADRFDKRRRLDFLDSIFTWAAGDGASVDDTERLRKDFFKRSAAQSSEARVAAFQQDPLQHQRLQEQQQVIVSNMVGCINSTNPQTDHVRRQDFLQCFAAGVPGISRELLLKPAEEGGYGIEVLGSKAWATTLANAGADDFSLSQPAAPAVGRYSLEDHDPALAERVAAFWRDPEYTRPDRKGDIGSKVLTCPAYVVARAIDKQHKIDGNLCCKSKSYQFCPEDVRTERLPSDYCYICDDGRKATIELENYTDRLKEKYGPNFSEDELHEIEKTQIRRFRKVIDLVAWHQACAKRQKAARDASTKKSMEPNSSHLTIALDYKGADALNFGRGEENAGERGPEHFNKVPVAVLGFCVWTPGSQQMKFYEIVSQSNDHTAFGASTGLKFILDFLLVKPGIQNVSAKVKTVDVFCDTGPHFRAGVFIGFVCGQMKQIYKLEATALQLLFEGHGKDLYDVMFQKHNSLKKSIAKKGLVLDVPKYVAALKAEVRRRNEDELFTKYTSCFVVFDVDLGAGDALFSQFKLVENFHMKGHYSYRSGQILDDPVEQPKPKGKAKAAAKKASAPAPSAKAKPQVGPLQNFSYACSLEASPFSDVAGSWVISQKMQKVERPPRAPPAARPNIKRAKVQKLELKKLHGENGLAQIAGDGERIAEIAQALKAYYVLDEDVVKLTVPNPPKCKENTFLKNRFKDLGRFCELYQEGHGFRSGIISDFDEAQELVTVRVFNFAGAWSYSFKLEELVKLTFEKPQQFFLYPRQGEKSRVGDVQGPAAPVLASASTDENLEEPKLIFAQCVTCEKFRYLPPSLPFAPIIKKISFTCQLKTGQQGCAAPFDETEKKHMNLQEQEFT